MNAKPNFIARIISYLRPAQPKEQERKPAAERKGFRVAVEDWPDASIWEPVDVIYGGPMCGYVGAAGFCDTCTGGVGNCKDPVLVCVRKAREEREE